MTQKIPTDRRYTDGHLWLKENADGSVDVGATEEGQSLLGDMVFVAMPEIGQAFTPRDAIATLESVKAASDMLLPLTGTVVATNPALQDRPELINQEPYDTWVFRLRVEGPQAVDLLSAEQYGKLIGSPDS